MVKETLNTKKGKGYCKEKNPDENYKFKRSRRNKLTRNDQQLEASGHRH